MPYDMQQLLQEADESLSENEPEIHSKFSQQGMYEPNGRLLSTFKTGENGKYRTNIHEQFGYLFGPQKKIYDNQPNPATIMQTMKMNHPNVTVLLDHHVTAINR